MAYWHHACYTVLYLTTTNKRGNETMKKTYNNDKQRNEITINHNGHDFVIAYQDMSDGRWFDARDCNLDKECQEYLQDKYNSIKINR